MCVWLGGGFGGGGGWGVVGVVSVSGVSRCGFIRLNMWACVAANKPGACACAKVVRTDVCERERTGWNQVLSLRDQA